MSVVNAWLAAVPSAYVSEMDFCIDAHLLLHSYTPLVARWFHDNLNDQDVVR